MITEKIANIKENPKFILVVGGVCTGKTTLRKEKYSSGFLQLDAGEIFIQLSDGEYFDFPSFLEKEMDMIGEKIAREAVSNRLNIVTEVLGNNYDEVEQLIDKMKGIGYDVDVKYIDCDLNVALERNQNRSDDNISAFYTQKYHFSWLNSAMENYSFKLS
jgi:hypothetical protein